ncbi:MAG TPA: efflux RND transporter periplasmic adaptor subunit [Polyangiaceae bacterium]|jgi:cobalt-zinc-cadmium efflux system membrane fusion protein
MSIRRAAFAVSLLLIGACHHPTEAPSSESPPGQAWLTETQIRDAKIAVAPVDDEDVDDTIVTSGKVAFDDARVAHIYSPVTGKVTRIDATLGQPVKKGDVLAVIDSPDLGNASADVGKAQADMIAAENDYHRKKGLFDQHAASQVDVEQAEDNFHKAQAELSRAREKLRLLKGGDGNYVSQGFPLTSPIDGEVMSRNVSPGIEVQGQYGGGTAVELFMVGEIDKVWVFADVYEMDVARVKIGSPVQVKIVAYPNRVFDSKIDWISGTLDPLTRTVRVRCSFDNPDKLLKPEMYATVTISVDQKKALALPHDAIVRMGDQNVVFVEVGKTPDGRMKFERRPVSVDPGEGNKWVPVDHGVEKGQRVVVSGGILLSGMM